MNQKEMDKRLKAGEAPIDLAIENWRDRLDHEHEWADCPLCTVLEAKDKGCEDCPVVTTGLGEEGCEETPFYRPYASREAWVKAMIEFAEQVKAAMEKKKK